MTGRITTRAGRKIRHVAPGHVVDVATGQHLWRWRGTGFGWWWLWYGVEPWGSPEWRIEGGVGPGTPQQKTLDRMLLLVARAEAVCALVRGMLAIGTSDIHA